LQRFSRIELEAKMKPVIQAKAKERMLAGKKVEFARS
jgi:hypothetical protein